MSCDINHFLVKKLIQKTMYSSCINGASKQKEAFTEI